MRRPLVKFSESEASNHTPSLADFTTTTPELKFSVHTSICFPLCPRTRTWLDAVGMLQTCRIWKSLTFNRQAVALGHQWRKERPKGHERVEEPAPTHLRQPAHPPECAAGCQDQSRSAQSGQARTDYLNSGMRKDC